jgi:hypothetical protein
LGRNNQVYIILSMEKFVKTANTRRHYYSKSFDKYLIARSSRNLRAILRAKRLEVGYFFLEFYPLVRDLFLMSHRMIDEREFEVLMQLHANQPFSIDDIRGATIKKKDFYGDVVDWSKKTSLGHRAAKDFLGRCKAHGIFKVFKENGRYNKKLWVLSEQWQNDFRRLYDNMLCLSDIRMDNHAVVHPEVRKSIPHRKKIMKQNNYRAKLPNEFERELKTTNGEFAILLGQARSEHR